MGEARTYSIEIPKQCLITTMACSRLEPTALKSQSSDVLPLWPVQGSNIQPWNPEVVSSDRCGLIEAWTYSLQIPRQCRLTTVAWARHGPTALKSRGSVVLPLWPGRGSKLQPWNPEAVSSYQCRLGKAGTYSLEISKQCRLATLVWARLEPTALRSRGRVFLQLWPEQARTYILEIWRRWPLTTVAWETLESAVLRSRGSVTLPRWPVSSYHSGLNKARTYSLEIPSQCLLTNVAWARLEPTALKSRSSVVLQLCPWGGPNLQPWDPETVSSYHCCLGESRTYSLVIPRQCLLNTVAWARIKPTALRYRYIVFLPRWPGRGSNIQPWNPEAVSSYNCDLGKTRTYSLEIPRQCRLTTKAWERHDPIALEFYSLGIPRQCLTTVALKSRVSVILPLWLRVRPEPTA